MLQRAHILIIHKRVDIALHIVALLKTFQSEHF